MLWLISVSGLCSIFKTSTSLYGFQKLGSNKVIEKCKTPPNLLSI